MTRRYNPKEIEAKWQARWDQDNLYRQQQDPNKPKWYFLTMFPYPSGRLHIGHWFMYAPPDAKARYLRMQGKNVFFPMGFDAFGLPAENAAIKHGVNPRKWTYDNIEYMRKEFRTMGASYTWSNEVITSDPQYYRWTQWLFIQFFRHGLAYRKKAPVDWCPKCNTSLAREQVKGEERRCDRCQTQVTKKDLDQWLFRITRYAEELLNFSQIQWPERVRVLQTEWIGRSEGAEIQFAIEDSNESVNVFTTRPDTLFGATFLVLAPEHPLVAKLTTPERQTAVSQYIEQAKRATEIDRLAANREKTGLWIGANALHPFTKQPIPIWIGDYVLMNYGTGAIMAVPAHDERDFAFAQQHNLPIPVVIKPPQWNGEPLTAPYTDEGVMVNSGQFDGTPSEEGKRNVTAALAQMQQGKPAITYRLHDWLISRQRYWGAPIPMIHCAKCDIVPVPDEQLPVLLPEDVQFLPTGESPLKLSSEFRNTTCPQCQGPAQRDTDTMDTFVDSSWYWYRYLSPTKSDAFIDPEMAKQWLPVDEYAGGIEHATMHLLYARFFAKALRDMGLIEHGEPFQRLFNQGLILGEDGNKMSKSRGNVVDPDAQVDIYGADCIRTFLMFIGPWEAGGPWSTQGIEGVSRFYKKVWNLILEPAREISGDASSVELKELQRLMHKTIGKVAHDLENFQFNTAVSSLMEYVNYLVKAKETAINQTTQWREAINNLVLLLAPIAPHISEELWEALGGSYSVHKQQWPEYNASLAADEVFTLVVQVNGKLRERIEGVPLSLSEAEARQLALSSPNVSQQIAGKEITNLIYVPKRLINIVIK
ncbi:MAG: leucine--tRNA ligase [Acidobacteriota bacterium]